MKEDKKDSEAPKAAEKPAAGRGAAAFRLAGFPKEFERNIWEDMDKRYMLIMLLSWVFTYGIAAILGSIDYDQDALAESARQKYLDKFFQAQIVSDIIEEDEADAGEGFSEEEEEEEDARAERDKGRTAETRGPSAREIAAQRRAAAAQRSAARRQMEQQIAGTGVLGLLSAAGGTGSGDAVVDVLGDAGAGAGDLGEVLSGVGGLATATSSGQRSRLGSRGGGRVSGIMKFFEGDTIWHGC